MKRKLFTCLLVIVCSVVFSNAYAQSGAAKGKGRVKGHISDPEGKPLDGVVVRFESPRLETSFEVKTDTKGDWIVSGMAGGAWNIDFIKEGFKDKKISVQISELNFNKPIEIAMEKKAAEAAPKQQVPGVNLLEEGNALRDAKDYTGAIAKYEAALQANPALNAVYGDIARAYSEMGQPDKAVESFKKFLELDPTNGEARVELANVLLAQKKMDDAKAVLAAGDISGVTDPFVVYNLGVGMYNAGQADEAIKYWEKAVTMDPKMTDAYLQMGFAYYSLSNMEKAKTSFQKVIEIEPGSDNAKSAQEMLDTMK